MWINKRTTWIRISFGNMLRIARPILTDLLSVREVVAEWLRLYLSICMDRWPTWTRSANWRNITICLSARMHARPTVRNTCHPEQGYGKRRDPLVMPRHSASIPGRILGPVEKREPLPRTTKLSPRRSDVCVITARLESTITRWKGITVGWIQSRRGFCTPNLNSCPNGMRSGAIEHAPTMNCLRARTKTNTSRSRTKRPGQRVSTTYMLYGPPIGTACKRCSLRLVSELGFTIQYPCTFKKRTRGSGIEKETFL